MRLFGTSYQQKRATIDAYLAQGGHIPLARYGCNPMMIVRGRSQVYVTRDGQIIGLGDGEVNQVHRWVKRHPVPARPKP